MATGIGYFSIGVDFFDNDTIVILETKYGSKATLLTIKLLGKIYGENFFYRWGEDELMLFTHKLGADYTADYVKAVVEALVNRGFFDKERFEKYGVLTSVEIQSLYFEAVQRRKQVEVEPDYLLVDVSKYKNVHKKGEAPAPPGIGEKAPQVQNVGIREENADIFHSNADICEQKKREEKEKKVPSSKSSPEGTPGGKEMREEDIFNFVPADGVKRNTQLLWNALVQIRVEPQDRQRLMKLGNWGEVGHPIWKAIYEINNSGGRILQPARFIVAKLMKKG
ncbi:DUF4373 domain-containing protein [Phocaeicola sp.]